MAEATVITDLFGHVEKTGKRKSKDERDRLRKSLLNHKFSLDCFRVPQPAFMSFSGGRTSALMLYYTLQAYDWKLPPDFRIVFMNTGMERWETLDFVHERGPQRTHRCGRIGRRGAAPCGVAVRNPRRSRRGGSSAD